MEGLLRPVETHPYTFFKLLPMVSNYFVFTAESLTLRQCVVEYAKRTSKLPQSEVSEG